MTKLQMLLFLISIAFIFFTIKIWRKKKIGFLTFCFLFLGSVSVAVFSLKIQRLNAIGITFGLNRGADLLVYLSIIILFYGVIYLYGKFVSVKERETILIRKLSLDRAVWSFGPTNIVFVIPAYNESDHALKVLESILALGYGVVFVDDGSSNDLYQKVCTSFSQKNLLAIKHVVNLGQWAALQTGFDAILPAIDQVKYVVTFDSDWQHCLEDLPKFLSAFEQEKDLEIALGSRFLWKAINMPYVKKLFLKLWILFTSIFSGLRLTDTHNGYRVIKSSSLMKITITMNGMEHASEILDIISNKKMKYKEVPNTIIYTEYSMAKWQKLSNSVKIVKNLLFKKFFG